MTTVSPAFPGVMGPSLRSGEDPRPAPEHFGTCCLDLICGDNAFGEYSRDTGKQSPRLSCDPRDTRLFTCRCR